jgi:hypothetical protein
MISNATLTDRESLTAMMPMVRADCAYCILETVESVCGSGCAETLLHIKTDYPILPRPCLPALAEMLLKTLDTPAENCGDADSLDRSASLEGKGGVLDLVGASAGEVACLLLKWLGPQGRSYVGNFTVVLPDDVGPIFLLGDLVVGPAESLVITAPSKAKAVLSLGQWQLRVRRGGTLVMRSLDIVDSRGGSALYSEGQVELVSCTFQRCSAGLNDVERAYESSVASGGANLKSKGGAIRSEGSASSLRAIDTSFLRCFANAKGLFSSHGGAVFAMVDSEVAPPVSFVGCSFVENVANSGSDRSSGGAVEIWDAIIIVDNSEFRSNEARQSGVGALTYGGAMTIVGGRRANVRIHDAVFH